MPLAHPSDSSSQRRPSWGLFPPHHELPWPALRSVSYGWLEGSWAENISWKRWCRTEVQRRLAQLRNWKKKSLELQEEESRPERLWGRPEPGGHSHLFCFCPESKERSLKFIKHGVGGDIVGHGEQSRKRRGLPKSRDNNDPGWGWRQKVDLRNTREREWERENDLG